MPGNTPPPDEITMAMQELALRRGMKFDQTDVSIWRQSLSRHVDCNGLILEAVRLLNADPDAYVTLTKVEDAIREVASERLARAETHMPSPPSGLSNEEYVGWIKVTRRLAIQGLSGKEIGTRARRALGLPPAGPAFQRPGIEALSRAFPELPRD